ncbi:hypothetical protein CA13_66960 [Planctomycetes bacterium CA13]|uniref:DUF1580 domain-containing protein n=1 Tax=Novipirellula herctigrandis TaxID=2527986 RepID=A0A5C5YMW6_9BACT|nr:hypothetical protein CA13_66960 [Planctomycetes bacterium CA13]
MSNLQQPQPLNLLTEDVVSLSQAAKELPHRPHVSTLWRWNKRGINGRKLETVAIGSRIFTSRQAVSRFLGAIQ